MMEISRRSFLRGSAAGVLGLAATTMISPIASAEESPKAFEENVAWDAEYDVIVLGYGLAGAVAALRAADENAKVLLVEKAPKGHEGGNSRYAGQSMLSIEGGVANRDAALAYFKRIRGRYNTPDDATLEAFLDSLLMAEEWYNAHGGQSGSSGSKIGEFRDVEGWDLMCCWSEKGEIFNAGTYLAVQRMVSNCANIDVWYNAAAEQFVQDEATKIVHGVKINVEGSSCAVRALNGVVLATGGFENNIQMIQDFHQLPEAYTKGALYNTGDGIKMAMEIGADLWHMNNIAGPDLNAIDPDTKRAIGYACIGAHPLLSTGFSLNSVIVVGADGTRFANESVIPGHGFINFHGMKLRQPVSLPAYVVFDKEAFIKTIYATWDNEAKVADGTIKKADTIDELCAMLNLPEGSLAATVAQYNEFCANGCDVQLGRNPDTLIALAEEGPYYAFEVKPTYTNTQGGPRRNADGSILDTHGNPIPHLYSAGECGSIWGDVYQGAGNLGECFAYGLISGAAAAAEKGDNLRASVMSGKTPINFTSADAEYETAANETIGVGTGMGGDVKVKVASENGVVSKVEVLEQNETPNIGSMAIDQLPEKFVGLSTAEEIDAIDSVSGATITSNALKNAVKAALGL